MGSVIDYIECPNCKSEDCYLDFYYKTGEEYCHCSDCGYTKNITIKNREKNLNELTQDDWSIVELNNPWGCYRIKEIGNVGWVCGTLKNEEEYNEIRDNVYKHIESVDEFSLSRFVENKIERRMIVSTGKLLNEIID